MGGKVFNSSHIPVDNQLLAALPNEDYRRLMRSLEPVTLAPGEVLYESGERVRHVYFLDKNTLVSLVSAMEDGMSIEAGIVGNEGMVGIQSFMKADSTLNRIVVQIPGSAMR